MRIELTDLTSTLRSSILMQYNMLYNFDLMTYFIFSDLDRNDGNHERHDAI